MRASSRPGFALLLGVALAALSRGYERIGPAPTSWRDTELCSFSPPRSCRDGVLQAGWPLAYLLDSPGISRVGQLALVEDRFRPAAFVADAAIGAIASGLILLGSVPRRRRKPVA